MQPTARLFLGWRVKEALHFKFDTTMNNSNVIRTFPSSELEGKSLEGILNYYRDILLAAKAEGYADFELVWNEEDSTYTAIGLDKMWNYVISPSDMAKVLKGLGITK